MSGSPASVRVVVYVDGTPYEQGAQDGGALSARDCAGEMAGADPVAIMKDFPLRWTKFIRAQFDNPLHVQTVFMVSERTAYRWWKGEGGVNGSHIAIAMNIHNQDAAQMLFPSRDFGEAA